jgi:polyketide synthase PksJ
MNKDIAVIGMECCVPSANNLEDFWNLILAGEEGLKALTPEQKAIISHSESENYITVGGHLEGIDLFDAEFFDLSPRDAQLMDPQHRLFLQACWQVLETNGYGNDQSNHNVGVFASAGPNGYLKLMLQQEGQNKDNQSLLLGNVPDCLATRVSYSLNLTGPSLTIQSGCSSSLVALHQARMALLAKQCDAALVGGICIAVPHDQGYNYVKGGMTSPDGHCRPFSNDAAGTVFASGFGVVMIKRLDDAINDGDDIYAVLKGSAVNNDGADKASFTAPSVNGQAAVIAKALRVANLGAKDIQYIEAHGTATPIGDPIELAALNLAFGQESTDFPQHIIGSVKANLGHLDVAAGIVGFIKTCLMLYHKILPPQINFQEWNLKFPHAPQHFKINSKLKKWSVNGIRRAGVSAFGFGGTNAHVILEETPFGLQKIHSDQPSSIAEKPIVLSAKSPSRLMQWIITLRQYLNKYPDLNIEDVAYTLQVKRSQLQTRFLVTVQTVPELISHLSRVTEQDFVNCTSKSETFDLNGKNFSAICQAWLSGYQVDWKSACNNTSAKKINLPVAPLQPKSYWFELADATSKNDQQFKLNTNVEEALYQSVWQQKIFATNLNWQIIQPILVLDCGNKHLTHAIVHYLQQNEINYCLVQKDPLVNGPGNHYQIDLDEKLPFMDLEKKWIAENKMPISCIACVATTALNANTSFPVSMILSLIKQTKLMNQLTQFSTLVTGMTSLHDNNVQPLLALMIGLSRGIGQEFSNVITQLIDLENEDDQVQLQQVVTSINNAAQLKDLCVWRQNKCWQQQYQLHPKPQMSTEYFEQEGVYIITGGLGDVASVHVEFLGKEYSAKLILLGQAKLPDPHEWSAILADKSADKKLQKKIRRLCQWQAAGFSVQYFSIDITNIADMRALASTLISSYGQINGIVHCAGVGSDLHYKILAELSWEHCWQLLAPKILGIEVIATLTKEMAIKNCLIISSISSALTGIGLSAYGASHNLLDALVLQNHPTWRVINWDAWNFYQDEIENNESNVKPISELDKLAISPEQGFDVLRYAFSTSSWQQLFISFTDLSQRHLYWVHRGFLTKLTPRDLHPRPNLYTEYAAPSSLIEQRIVSIWQNLLGLDRVGINDNFFELGGHSLLALELIKFIQTELNYSCSVIEVFESPTVAQFVNKIQATVAPHHALLDKANDRASRQLAARQNLQSVRGKHNVNN